MTDRDALISDLRDFFTMHRWIDTSDLEGATMAVDFFLSQQTGCGDPDCSCPECPTGQSNSGMDCPYYIASTGGRKDLPGAFGPGTCKGGCVDEPRCMV